MSAIDYYILKLILNIYANYIRNYPNYDPSSPSVSLCLSALPPRSSSPASVQLWAPTMSDETPKARATRQPLDRSVRRISRILQAPSPVFAISGRCSLTSSLWFSILWFDLATVHSLGSNRRFAFSVRRSPASWLVRSLLRHGSEFSTAMGR